jgi:ABC-type phosphate transport system substrate-binding protein
MKTSVVLLLVLSIILPGISYANEDRTFKIIVHASNPNSELTKNQISKLFLKKVKMWEDMNEAVLPIDLVADSPVREEFSAEIHGKKVSPIKAYWQKQIFSGRNVPPEEKASDEGVLEYVEENVGAIGYVSEIAPIDQYDVKIVVITE